MALIFPVSLPNLVELLKIESVTWNLKHQQEYSGLGSGEGLSHDLAPPLWEAEVSTAQIYHAEVEKWRARFNTLDGSNNSFMLYNPAARFPETDPTGTLLSGLTVTILSVGSNRKEMSLAGLPAGFVVPWGAYTQIAGGTPQRVALVQFAESKTATGAGNTSALELRPHLRPWVSAGMAVTLINPSAKVKLNPGSLRVESAGPLTSRLRFSALQTLAAG